MQSAPDAPAADVSNPSEDAADIFDVPEDDAPAAAPVPQFRDDDDDGEDEDYLDEEDDEDLADDDEEDEPSEGALTRFLHLFVDRADEEDDEEDEEDEDDAADGDAFESDVDESVGVFAPVERRPLGGEIDMQEPRKIDTEMTELMAEGLGERTLSRRERRELQQRREAEREAIAPASGHDEDMEDGVDEPTREFMPISRERAATSSREIEPPASLFDDDEDEEEIEPPISRRAQRLQRKEARLDEEYEDEDDYDDEDEDEPAPKKRSARTSRRHAYDEDDEDDYDDDYDDDDDEDDDYDEPRSRRGGHGRHRRHGSRDDYDDYDDDDDYDDYDDDYDDYDDYDDDERHSIGHHILGFFKGLIFILLALCIIVLAMNILHRTGTVDISGLRDTVREWSPTAADLLFVAVGDDEGVESTDDGTADVNQTGEDANSGVTDNTDANNAENTTDADGAQTSEGSTDMAPVAPVG